MKLELHQGAYEARSQVANAQVCINLYPEPNSKDAPFPVTHYPAPGLSIAFDLSALGSTVRGLYVASDSSAYAVVGTAVVRLMPGSTPPYVLIGQLTTDTNLPVSMVDNGVTLVMVDGSNQGWMVALSASANPGSLQLINDTAFYGANRVDYIDTFMIFNQIGTNNFYTTTSGVVTPFDPTYVASKEGWADRLVTLAALHDNIWLIGAETAEVWYNAGGTTFPFARMPNSILQQGTGAAYSVVIADNAIYWLSQDRWGHAMMMRGEGYAARRISTFAVEDAWSQYASTYDCIGMAYQIGGHETVGFYFPTGNAWWGYDASTQMWHERLYGTTEAWLPYCTAFWGVTPAGLPAQTMLAGDRLSGRIYNLTRDAYTDNGQPITRQRSWTHAQQDGNRVYHTRFSANLQATPLAPDTIDLDWSDDNGQTYGTPVPQTINNQSNGQYQWRRLGYARDRVYRLTWQGQGECALNGAYIDIVPGGT